MSYGNVVHSAAAEAARVLLAKPGALLLLAGVNNKNAAQFIQVFDAKVANVSVAEISTIDFDALVGADLAGKSFTIAGDKNRLRVWFNVDDEGADPTDTNAGEVGIEVALAGDDTDEEIATAVAAALEAHADFTASATTTVATITHAVKGERVAIDAGDTEATVAVTTPGVNGFDDRAPVAVLKVPADSSFNFPLLGAEFQFEHGIVVANSSTLATHTAGSADCFFTAVVVAK